MYMEVYFTEPRYIIHSAAMHYESVALSEAAEMIAECAQGRLAVEIVRAVLQGICPGGRKQFGSLRLERMRFAA